MQTLLDRNPITTPPALPTLADLHRRYNRAGITDLDGLQRDVDLFIAQTVGLDATTLDQLAGIYAFIAENMEREQWRYYTAEYWRRLEYGYVEKSGYTKPDLFDDILTAVEAGELSEVEAQATALQYRECRHVFCLNVFNGRKDQRYCSADCRYRHAQARARVQEFPYTTLPPSAYKENRNATDDANYRERETAYEDSTITEVIEPFERAREHGYRRDRGRELTYVNVNDQICG